jgi:ribonuclease-3
MSLPAQALEKILGHSFQDDDLLRRALTHKSRVYERGAHEALSDNEQLEFLGDSILGFIVSEHLVARFPDFEEGQLSKLKAHLVSSTHLFEVAHSISLGEYLLLGRGEEMSGGREKKALLANAVEALIAALYLDGGIVPARSFVLKYILGEFHPQGDGLATVTDYKSALQETAQALKLPQPRYTILEERGPEHAKTFLVEVRVGRDWVSQAEGLSKKSAGQKAAQQILAQLSPGQVVDRSPEFRIQKPD